MIPGGSLWSQTLPESDRVSGAPLDVDIDVDVAIVGAGLTGLWTALSLLERDPHLRVAVLERETIGFGASGRNGGWCSGFLPMSVTAMAHGHGREAAQNMQRAIHATVGRIGEFASQHNVDCGFKQGGTLLMARNQPQADRLINAVATMHKYDFGPDDARWLDKSEASKACNATDLLGAYFTPHSATIDPMRLTHGVARVAIAMGAKIYEHTPVTQIGKRFVVTPGGTVKAGVVVSATEGYTSQLTGQRRTMLPIYSMMIATEPLSTEIWRTIGLSDRATFADGRHYIVYGQRTADGRLVFGGRGAPYHFASAIRPEFDTDRDIQTLLTAGMIDMFPMLAEARVTHHWGGVLGAPRDWTCSVNFDRKSGFATAGGYVGDGVSTTNLAGRTLAALITDSNDDADKALTQLLWVGHQSPKWEPEPLRWLGVNVGRFAAGNADRVENRTGKPSKLWGGLMNALIGH